MNRTQEMSLLSPCVHTTYISTYSIAYNRQTYVTHNGKFWGTCKSKTARLLSLFMKCKTNTLHCIRHCLSHGRVSGFFKGDSKKNSKYNYLPLKCFFMFLTITRTTTVIATPTITPPTATPTVVYTFIESAAAAVTPKPQLRQILLCMECLQ